MKRILLILSLLSAGNLFAADKLKVVTATEDPASITREIGGAERTSYARSVVRRATANAGTSAARQNPSKGLTNTVGIGGHPLRPEQA